MPRNIKIKKPRRQRRRTIRFPKDFLWGAATSAYQVEGGITKNDWAVAERLPPAGAACDHYHRYEQDFLLAKKLNHNAHRLSLEWSRIEPAEDQWDEEALEHYYHVLEFLKNRGVTTFVTLHHFTNPLWFARAGGWASPKAAERFGSYVSKVAQTLGQFIDFWVTINEPNVYAAVSFMEGRWPPFEKSAFKALRVFHNMLKAHNQAYEIIHAYYPQARVGLAQNITFNEPASKKSFFARLAVKFLDWLDETYTYRHTRNDFIGLNYYFHNRLKFIFDPNHLFMKIVNSSQGRLSERGWEIYPQGLYEVLRDLAKFQKPIYITENGIADAQDKLRGKFIIDHLRAIHRAIQKGVLVRGYLHWSLLDNYEWEDGYKWKFGLVAVDFKTQRRHIRGSAELYARICKTNALPPLNLPLTKGEKKSR